LLSFRDTVDSPFRLITKAQSLAIYRCPLCFSEFSSKSRVLKSCPKCRYPSAESDFKLAIKRARTEIDQLIREKGYILQRTELEPVIETLRADFPKVQPVDIWGMLGLNRRDERIRRQRYDLDLHAYPSAEQKPKRSISQALSEETLTRDPVIRWLRSVESKRKESRS